MAKIKLLGSDEGIWVNYSDSVRFKLRPLSSLDVYRIIRRARKRKVVDGILTEDVDELQVLQESFDHALLEWEGIETDEPAEPDEIREAIFRHDALRTWILEQAKALNNKILELEADKKKG